MVRHYVRKSDRQSWSEESMKAAVNAVLGMEMSLRKASLSFEIPRTTLIRKIAKYKDNAANIDDVCEKNSEEVPRRRLRRRRGEDQNNSRNNESVDMINYMDGFGSQMENSSNENPSIPVNINCDMNVVSPASSMNDSMNEQPKVKKKRALSFSKDEEKIYSTESIESGIIPTNSDEKNEIDAFCMRLASSMRRLPSKTRSKVEIDILKLIYEAEYGEKV